MTDKVLILNDKFQIEISPEILQIKEFQDIIAKNKKNVENAKKEIAYIYHMCNVKSPYYNYSYEEREKKLNYDLFGKFEIKWEPDEKVKQAMVKYQEMIKTPSLHVLDTLLSSLHECNDIVSEITKQLKEDLKAGKHKTGLNNKKGQIVSGVELMLNDLTALLKVSKEIPTHIDTLEKIYEKVSLERTKISKVRGNVEISDRER